MNEHLTLQKPKALDLYCGGGGAAIGLLQAGFEVYGVDIKPHKNYPGHLIIADVLNLPLDPKDFDFVWTSPPCQAFSIASNRPKLKEAHPNLIPETRELIKNHPYYVIENVPQAPIRPDLVLWGPQFGLNTLWRKRSFELSFWVTQPNRPIMERGQYNTITKGMGNSNHFYRRKAEGKQGTLTTEEAKETMGIPPHYKMTQAEIGEAVAPPMAKYIAEFAMRQIRGEHV